MSNHGDEGFSRGTDMLGGYIDYIDGGSSAPTTTRSRIAAPRRRSTTRGGDNEDERRTSSSRSDASDRLLRVARDRHASIQKQASSSSKRSSDESDERQESRHRHSTSSSDQSEYRLRHSERAKRALAILAAKDHTRMEMMGYNAKRVYARMERLLAHSKPLSEMNRVSKTFGYCGGCREPDHGCCCVAEKKVVTCVGGYDGHPICLINPLVFAKYGYVFGSSGAGPINFSMTAGAEPGSFLLAPLNGVLVADFNDEFGFDADTRSGTLIVIANLPLAYAGGNGFYVITSLPSDTASPVYKLRRATPFADECFKVRVGSAVFVTLGDSAGIYIIDTFVKPCCGSPITFTLAETNYGDFSVGVQVSPACNPCTKLVCASPKC